MRDFEIDYGFQRLRAAETAVAGASIVGRTNPSQNTRAASGAQMN